MNFYSEHHTHSYTDYQDEEFTEEHEDLGHKKKIRRLLEDRLEKKRLRDEFKDEFDEDDEFDWSDLDK